MTKPRRKNHPHTSPQVALSPLAQAVYQILCGRVGLPDPRITYKELAGLLRDTEAVFEYLTHRSRELYAALWEVGDACRLLTLPPLPALVVRADTRRPGDAYFEGMNLAHRGQRIAAWQSDLDAVCQATYPPRP